MANSWVILTSCFFPSRRPLKFLEKSAQLVARATPLRTYGDGEQYANWTQMKVNRMIPELEKLRAEGFTHYLYTDGRDAFFTRPFSYIVDAYSHKLGSPDGLLSGQPEPFTMAELAHHNDFLKPAKYRHHCCGGYMGSIDYWLETHRKFVMDKYESRPTGGDEAGVWQWAWADGWFRPQIDTGCKIWQNLGGCEDDVSVEYRGRLHNHVTHSDPAILHFTGYCKDPVYGVYDAMKPWWDLIYPDYPIQKDEIIP
jgi:hypothetical protein